LNETGAYTFIMAASDAAHRVFLRFTGMLWYVGGTLNAPMCAGGKNAQRNVARGAWRREARVCKMVRETLTIICSFDILRLYKTFHQSAAAADSTT